VPNTKRYTVFHWMSLVLMKYDLHSHSHYSDGSLSPTELVKQATKHGISHLALTDHDSVSGLTEAQQAAKHSDLTLINGVELSCTWQHQLLHVVGLDLDPSNETLLAGIQENRQRRTDRAQAMFEDLERHDIFIRDDVQGLLYQDAVPTRPHFAQALVERGYAKDKRQAFKRYLVRGKPGFVAMQWPELEKIGAWITAAGGVGVLAHPTRYNFTRSKLIRLIGDMQAADIQGMEVSTAITNNQQEAMLAQLVLEHGLFASTGSDFHSNDQPWAQLGHFQPLAQNLTPVWSQF